MSDNCCNPIIPPACEHKCDKLVDACCVVNEDGLPCLIPPVIITEVGISAGSQGFSDSTVSDVLPNPFYGVITITSPTTGIFAEGTTVTKIIGDVVYFSQPPIGSDKVDVVFTFTEQRQCDINKAIDKLCSQGSGAVCSSWTNGVLSDPIMGLTWVTGNANPPTPPSPPSFAGFASAVGCRGALRGAVKTTVPASVVYTAVNSQLFVISDPAARPLIDKAISTVAVINSDTQFTALYLPAIVIIRTTGEVQIAFTNFNPRVPTPSGCVPCAGPEEMATLQNYFAGANSLIFYVTLDGVTYDINL